MSRNQRPRQPDHADRSFDAGQKDRIIRNFFRAASEPEDSLCPCCGEPLQFRLLYRQPGGGRIRVLCPDCGSGFEWRQSRPARPFSKLQLAYFVERHQQGEVLRCPIDDSAVTTVEFGRGIMEFRCPYCNRVASTAGPDSDGPRNGNQLIQLA